MHCLVRDCRLESDTGGQKNGQIYKNRNSTASLGIHWAEYVQRKNYSGYRASNGYLLLGSSFLG
ncbi:hypothetical protein D1819_06985 [Pseudoalteromonas tunicata]|nr:hypothetical protein D1819_06985 [Pseudoalteromonas tunicata]